MQLAAEMQCSVGFVDPQVFLSTMIQWQPREVEEALIKAMMNDYVIGAYNIGGHWVTVIIAIKFGI